MTILNELPENHALRNLPLGEIGGEYLAGQPQTWRSLVKFRIARNTYNQLGPAWTKSGARLFRASMAAAAGAVMSPSHRGNPRYRIVMGADTAASVEVTPEGLVIEAMSGGLVASLHPEQRAEILARAGAAMYRDRLCTRSRAAELAGVTLRALIQMTSEYKIEIDTEFP